MGRVTASGIVTAMKHPQFFRVSTVMNLIRVSMGQYAAIARENHAVSMIVAIAFPFPTVVGAAPVEVDPKQIFGFAPLTMPVGIGDWFALHPTVLSSILCGYPGFLPATAVAVTVRNFVRGIMGLHRSHLSVPSLGRSQRRQALSIGCYSFIIPQEAAYG